jgi:hypothetical protein
MRQVMNKPWQFCVSGKELEGEECITRKLKIVSNRKFWVSQKTLFSVTYITIKNKVIRAACLGGV